MRSAMLVILIVFAPAWAQAPAVNTLTPEQAREGWILLFDGESKLGWEVTGDVKVERGRITSASNGTLTWRSPILRGIVQVEIVGSDANVRPNNIIPHIGLHTNEGTYAPS